MKHTISGLFLLVLATATTPQAQAQGDCMYGNGVPGLAGIAHKLGVKPTVGGSRTSVMDCGGKSYEIGALLAAMVARIERAEKNAADALKQKQ